jgi:hypothetical protein
VKRQASSTAMARTPDHKPRGNKSFPATRKAPMGATIAGMSALDGKMSLVPIYLFIINLFFYSFIHSFIYLLY